MKRGTWLSLHCLTPPELDLQTRQQQQRNDDQPPFGHGRDHDLVATDLVATSSGEELEVCVRALFLNSVIHALTTGILEAASAARTRCDRFPALSATAEWVHKFAGMIR